MSVRTENRVKTIREYILSNYKGTFREPEERIKYPYIVPGSDAYSKTLWDWDSWLTNIALRQIVLSDDNPNAEDEIIPYERGCVLNFLSRCDGGWIPIFMTPDGQYEIPKPDDIFSENMHKPVLAQHVAFLVKCSGGDAEWIREKFGVLQAFVNVYRNHYKHSCGLYFWQTDFAIGVDNDPCTFYRPPKSSGSIFLNCLMYKEYQAMAYICDCLNLNELSTYYRKDADSVKNAILEHCWDERDGFFYSVDLNLLPIDHTNWLHSGCPRDWDCLIQRIGVWSGFLALWAEIATQEQAQRVVEENYRNTKTFNAPFGVRTLSKLEKMYNVRGSGNPSNWLGPIWGISNYLTFRGLVKYGFHDDAAELARKTIELFGRDIERFGAMHEYYQPDNGEPVINRGFQNWNLLVLNMIDWLDGKPVAAEF
ncbi:MAG: trehalase family glycosidase [Armatimonadota bacterium]|nr:glycoside hydrolase family 37 [bacterium]